MGHVNFDIAADEKVETAVVVVIQESRAGAVIRPLAPVGMIEQAGPGRDVFKPAAALAIGQVAIEHVRLAEAGQEQRRVAAVVDVADGNALAAADVGQADLAGYIAELAASQILVKLAGGRVLGVGRNEGVALNEEQIHQAILVVVKPGKPGAGLVHDVFHVGTAIEVLEVDAGLFRDFAEANLDAGGEFDFRARLRSLHVTGHRLDGDLGAFRRACRSRLGRWLEIPDGGAQRGTNREQDGDGGRRAKHEKTPQFLNSRAVRGH